MNIPTKKIAIGGGAILSLSIVAFLSIYILEKSTAKDAVLKRLKDPSSAIFGEYTRIGDKACLGVNAKNSMGGYVGERQARLFRSDGKWLISGFEEADHTQCVTELEEREAAITSMEEFCKGHKELIEVVRKGGRDTARLEEAGRNIGCR